MSLPKVDTIADQIAEDVWSYADETGDEVKTRIIVGRPEPIPEDGNGDWFCPVYIERFTPGVSSVGGVGPVDALMNALVLVKAFSEKVDAVPRAEHNEG